MPNPSKPITVLIQTKKPHMSNAEIEQRRKNEEALQTDADKVNPPKWLSEEAKKVFRKIVKELKKVKLVTNLDVNSLAIYADNVVKYAEYEKELTKLNQLLDEAEEIEDVAEKVKVKAQIHKTIVNYITKKLQIGDTIRKYSVEFGLTAQSRARLAIPREKKEEKSEEEVMFGNV